jgi:putative intracellular protease/amidase
MENPNKIAVLVESLYIPEEIKTYQDRFEKQGYSVDLVANLWGHDSITVFSDNISDISLVGTKPLEQLEVCVDVQTVSDHLSDYAAVLVAANYTSVRSRYFTTKDGSPRNAPAVRLITRAMQEPSLVKAALCHGLWLLTPVPDLLAGRRVICHEVVQADIANAGAVIDTGKKIVVDGDLVTGHSKQEAADLVDQVLALVARVRNGKSLRGAAVVAKAGATVDNIAAALAARFDQVPVDAGAGDRPVAKAAGALLDGTLDVSAEVKRLTGIDLDMSRPATHKPIILVASKFGTWASELTLVAAVLLRAGYRVTVATEDGAPPHMLGPSLNPEFTDGAWRCAVVSPEERDLAHRFLDSRCPEHELLIPDNILNLSHLAKPPQVGDYLKDRSSLDRYRNELKHTVGLTSEYDGIIIAGGSGAIPGLMADRGLQALILAFHDQGKPVMGECNGGLAIAQTVDPATNRSILAGRAVTTHSWLDEYQSGWGWTHEFTTPTDRFWTEGIFDLAAYLAAEQWHTPGTGGNPLIDSEALFKNAAGEDGVFFSPPGSPYSVVVDGNLITCRTTPDGYPGVLAVMARLDGQPPLRGRLFIDGDKQGRPRP